MHKIIVIQLARFGDILQTLPTIQGLKKKFPESEITFVVRKTFSNISQICPHVDNLVEFDAEKILSPILFEQKTEESLKLLRTWVQELTNSSYDLLLNLTFSPASAFLSSLIEAKEKKGILGNTDGNFSIIDSRSQYFFAQVLSKNLNILHNNDLFAKIAGVGNLGYPFETISQPVSISSIPSSRNIGIQLTASQNEKTLKVDAWKLLCEELLKQDPSLNLIFFGSKSDIPLVQEVTRDLDSGKYISVAGTCSFAETIPLLQKCEAIVSPDTALVHLASLINTKVVQISVGPVRPEETGPYGNGHHILKPNISNPVFLARNVLQALTGKRVDHNSFHWTTQLVTQNNGFVRNELVPANFEMDEATHFFERSYYLLFEFRCEGIVDEIEIPKIGSPAQIARIDRFVQTFDALCTLRKTAEFGQHYCFAILENLNVDMQKVQENLDKISEIEKLLYKISQDQPLLKPLIDAWIIGKDMAHIPAQEYNVENVISFTEGAYRELVQNTEILQQLLETAVNKAQSKNPNNEVETKKDKDL